jgi:hypothetical protein
MITDFRGTKPTGSHSTPRIAFINELLPQLNCPTTASVNRSAAREKASPRTFGTLGGQPAG